MMLIIQIAAKCESNCAAEAITSLCSQDRLALHSSRAKNVHEGGMDFILSSVDMDLDIN